MTPTGKKALMLGLGYGILAMNNDAFNADDGLLQYNPHPKTQRQSTLTPKQRKKREKSKQARKARRKNK